MFIRHATSKDAEGIKKLLDALNHSSVEHLPHFFKIAQTTTEQVEELINNKNCQLILAEDKDRIIGVIEIYLNTTKSIPVLISKQYIYIQNLIVEEAYRRKGVGKALLSAAKKWGDQRGVKSYRLSVIPNNTSAIKFYEKEGYEMIMYSMEKRIKED